MVKYSRIDFNWALMISLHANIAVDENQVIMREIASFDTYMYNDGVIIPEILKRRMFSYQNKPWFLYFIWVLSVQIEVTTSVYQDTITLTHNSAYRLAINLPVSYDVGNVVSWHKLSEIRTGTPFTDTD